MNILTFDLEDWFHLLEFEQTKGPEEWQNFHPRIVENTYKILDVLDIFSAKATFFVLGHSAENHPELIREIASRGHHIGCHSYAHQLVHQQTPQAFSNDLIRALDLIENVIGKKVTAYRAPGFSITNSCCWAFEILAEHGIKIDSSLFLSKRAHGGFSQFPSDGPAVIRGRSFEIKEFPIVPARFFLIDMIYSGGGYFRLLPSALIKKFFTESVYNMTYFHPRDFDPGQPKLEGLSFGRRFKSYVGLDKAIFKLQSLLEDFDFKDLETTNLELNWNQYPQLFLKSNNSFEIQTPAST